MWGLFFGYVLEEKSKITQNASIAAGQWLVDRGFPALGETVAAVGGFQAGLDKHIAGMDVMKRSIEKNIHAAKVLYEKGLIEGGKQLADEQLDALIKMFRERTYLPFLRMLDPCDKYTWYEQILHGAVGAGNVATAALIIYGGAQGAKNFKNRKFGSKNKPPQTKKIKNQKTKKKGPEPNDGKAKQHGNPDHDAAINDKVNQVRQEGGKNIRKNQQQVDVNGNNVGGNQPDLQWDVDGKHHNWEIDRTKNSSLKHQRQIPANDPNATNYFENL